MCTHEDEVGGGGGFAGPGQKITRSNETWVSITEKGGTPPRIEFPVCVRSWVGSLWRSKGINIYRIVWNGEGAKTKLNSARRGKEEAGVEWGSKFVAAARG